jgi:uncharacterized metal-binding protein
METHCGNLNRSRGQTEEHRRISRVYCDIGWTNSGAAGIAQIANACAVGLTLNTMIGESFAATRQGQMPLSMERAGVGEPVILAL